MHEILFFFNYFIFFPLHFSAFPSFSVGQDGHMASPGTLDEGLRCIFGMPDHWPNGTAPGDRTRSIGHSVKN